MRSVWVVMGNDFPDAVFDSLELADKYVNEKKEADKKRHPRHSPPIHWRHYEFPLNNEGK